MCSCHRRIMHDACVISVDVCVFLDEWYRSLKHSSLIVHFFSFHFFLLCVCCYDQDIACYFRCDELTCRV